VEKMGKKSSRKSEEDLILVLEHDIYPHGKKRTHRHSCIEALLLCEVKQGMLYGENRVGRDIRVISNE
jgi:hypothetical protein